MAEAPPPDPVHGVFATLLVADGRPLELDAHLARLDASVRELYGMPLPADARRLATERARGAALARLRLSAVPGPGGAVRLDAVACPVERAIVLPGWEHALALAPVRADGWRGAHKWADRRLLERLDAQAAPAAALLVDRERGVLETTRANVFAVGADGVLRTPPLDGAILPGVTRALVVALAREAGLDVREERLSLEHLRAAREAFATGSVRGVEPIRSIDSIALGDGGEVTALAAGALRDRWGVGGPPRKRSFVAHDRA